VAGPLTLAWDERLTEYDFGPGHPLAPVRVELTMELARAFGVLAEPGVDVVAPSPAPDAELELIHDPDYIAAVRRAGEAARPDASVLGYGLGTADDPVFPGMHEASALVAGATMAAARAMWSGAAEHGASIAGGLFFSYLKRSGSRIYSRYADPAG